MNLAKAILYGASEELIDYILVANTAAEMKAKLSKKREDGRKEWYRPNTINNTILLDMLQAHLLKGDMIDVINLAAMIHARESLHGESTS